VLCKGRVSLQVPNLFVGKFFEYKNIIKNKALPAPLLSKSVVRGPPNSTVIVLRNLILAKPVLYVLFSIMIRVSKDREIP
jgi:hypothetical protein